MIAKSLRPHLLTELLALVVATGLVLFSTAPRAAEKPAKEETAASAPAQAKPKIDRSGRTQTGKASIYSEKFNNKTMADGNKMDPHDDNAASKTLPLGTKAKVTNLETGQSTEVTIQDRGPHVKGRIVDLPPAKAKEIGLTKKQGVAKVEVAPVEIPLPNGGVKLGAGAETKED